MSPLVSVVIPAHDNAAFVGAAVRSVLAQSHRPLELVVVDDGSTDGTREVIREVSRWPSIDDVRVLVQPNRGAPAAIMRGLAAARGDVLAILNADDVYHPERLAALVPRLTGPTAFAFSGVEFIDAEGRGLPPDHAWPSWYAAALRDAGRCPSVGYALLLHNFSVSSGNFVFTRALYEELGGFSEHRFCHDWDFLIRAVYHTEPAWVRRPLLSYRVHGANTTEKVRDRLYAEAMDALGRYLRLCEAGLPPNPLAPCAANWPRFFSRFTAGHHPFFAPDRPLSAFLG